MAVRRDGATVGSGDAAFGDARSGGRPGRALPRGATLAIPGLVFLAVLAFLPGASAQAPSGGPDLGNYLFFTSDLPEGPAFDYVEIADGEPLEMFNCLSRQSVTTAMVPIGFDRPFKFYDREFTQVRANVYGQLQFLNVPTVSTTPNECTNPAQYGIALCTGFTCPPGGAGNPNYQVAAYWQAWGRDPSDPTSGLYAKTIGTPGNRVFIFEWYNVRSCPFNQVTNFQCSNVVAGDREPGPPSRFQVKLFEKDHSIEVHVEEASLPVGTNTNAIRSRYVVMGIEGSGARVGTKWRGLAYTNQGHSTVGLTNWVVQAPWAIRYMRDEPPVAAFEVFSSPSNKFHNGNVLDDEVDNGPERNYVHPNQTILFSDRSTDADGPIVSWEWDFGDGSPVTAENAKRNPVHQYTVTDTTYTVKLKVSDGFISSTTQRTVNVTDNIGPVADFTVVQGAVAGEALLFEDRSTDVDGRVARWTWDFGDATLSEAERPIHHYVRAGTYTVQLTIEDDDVAPAHVKRIVTVLPSGSHGDTTLNALAPVVEAGLDQTVPPGSPVRLHGYQTNGHAEVYRWEQVAGPRVELAAADTGRPSFTAPMLPGREPAKLTFRLVVSDRGMDSLPDEVSVTVAHPNSPPRLAIPAPARAAPFDEVFLRVDATDPDGDAVQYEWTQTLGPTVALEQATTATPTFLAPGTDEPTVLAFRVVATDGKLASSGIVVAEVAPDTVGFTIASEGEGVYAFVPVHEGVGYQWDFGDGATSSEPSPKHAFASGQYVVRVTVTGFDGETYTFTKRLGAFQRPDQAVTPDIQGRDDRSAPGAAVLAALAVLAMAAVVARRK